MEELKFNFKKNYCSNCGKYGHNYNLCNEPITSFGIIAIKFANNKYYNEFKHNNNGKNIKRFNTKNNNVLFKSEKLKNKVKFLIICRRNTLGYLEFIRGRYTLNNIEYIISLFEQMTNEEANYIRLNKFEILWNTLWNNIEKPKYLIKEYESSKIKFNKLKERCVNNLDNIISLTKRKYKNPEWGFPKGRRHYLEKDINCAKREFIEETGIDESDFFLFENTTPLQEIFKGTNDVLYKHVYYLAVCKNDIEAKIKNKEQNNEIGNIGWYTYDECINLFRNFHVKRRYLINEIYIYISNFFEKNSNI